VRTTQFRAFSSGQPNLESVKVLVLGGGRPWVREERKEIGLPEIQSDPFVVISSGLLQDPGTVEAFGRKRLSILLAGGWCCGAVTCEESTIKSGK
jgi:hypothetical protein